MEKTDCNLKFISSIILSLILITNNYPQENNFPLVQIEGTQLRTIYSKIVDQEYKLLINLPGNYSESSEPYPVIYLLDAQWDFTLLQAIYGEQYFDGFLPSSIIVGITWGGENPNPDALRLRDFTPIDLQKDGSSGNALKFHNFIENELIPFIEENYNASKEERVLMGSSLGGLFTLYSLFEHNGIFNKYVLTSPALNWGNKIIYSFEDKYSGLTNRSLAKVYVAFGEMEVYALPEFHNLIELLNKRDYAEISLKTNVIEGIGHSGGKADGYTRGLQYVFQKPDIEFSNDELLEYEGKYISNNTMINVSVENAHLMAAYQYYPKMILSAEKYDKFYVKGQFSNFNFLRDSKNKINGLELELFAGKTYFNKID